MTFNTELWNGQAPGAGGYAVERSLRFNSADTAYLGPETFSSPTSSTAWTWAGWIKKTLITTSTDYRGIFDAGSGSNYAYLDFSDNGIRYVNRPTSGTIAIITTTPVFRDPSAWFHLVFVYDSANGTSTDRLRLYINGTRVTTFSSATYPDSSQASVINSAVAHRIGFDAGNSGYLDAYLADIHFLDGQTPGTDTDDANGSVTGIPNAEYLTDFGEFDATTGIWNPIEYTGTYPGNSFHLDFSDNSSAAALGTDTSGNGNTWTVNNISVTAGAGNDSLVDVPTNGTETDTGSGGEVRGNYCTMNPLKKGSTYIALSNGNLDGTRPSTGTAEVVLGTIGMTTGKWYWEMVWTSGTFAALGIATDAIDLNNNIYGPNGWAYQSNGRKGANNSTSSYGATFAIGDVIAVAFNADNGQLTFYKNNTSQGVAFTVTTGVTYFPSFGIDSMTGWSVNFGQRPFAYTAPSGFKALCTANLDAPVVTKPSEYMDVVTYTGNGGTQTISGLEFNPDFVWIKRRNSTNSHRLQDSVRGVTKYLESNTTAAEADAASAGVTAFNSDGFSLGSGASFNASGGTYVGWTWDAGSSTVSNTDGSITSTVRANPSAGFSIVSYTGPGSSATIGHGLNAAPEFIIAKNRDYTDPWAIYHVATGANKLVYLDTSAASTVSGYWGSGPTSSVFGIGNYNGVARSGDDFIAYCFAPVDGYSSFGSYTGNGSDDGPFVYTGMRPKWIMFKASSTTGRWVIHDTERAAYNASDSVIYANESDAEYTNSAMAIDIVGNGFKIRTGSSSFTNSSGVTYIWAAFAEHPLKYARAR